MGSRFFGSSAKIVVGPRRPLRRSITPGTLNRTEQPVLPLGETGDSSRLQVRICRPSGLPAKKKIPWGGLALCSTSGRVEVSPTQPQRSKQVRKDHLPEQSAIHAELDVIFVSLELSRSI